MARYNNSGLLQNWLLNMTKIGPKISPKSASKSAPKSAKSLPKNSPINSPKLTHNRLKLAKNQLKIDERIGPKFASNLPLIDVRAQNLPRNTQLRVKGLIANIAAFVTN
jgi:hypothetical protein